MIWIQRHPQKQSKIGENNCVQMFNKTTVEKSSQTMSEYMNLLRHLSIKDGLSWEIWLTLYANHEIETRINTAQI